MAQIRWLPNLALLDCDIKYRTGKANKAAAALSHCPYVPGEMNSGSDSEKYETILYTTVCEELGDIIDGEELPIACKVAIQEKNRTSLLKKNWNCTPV